MKHVSVAAFDDDGMRQRELNRYYDGEECDFAAMEEVAEDFRIDPGVGVYLPSFVPHWVTTQAGVSVSFSIPFYTEFSERAESVNRINHRLRKLHSPPSARRVRARRPRQGRRLRAMGQVPRHTAQGAGIASGSVRHGLPEVIDLDAPWASRGSTATGSSWPAGSRARRTSRHPIGSWPGGRRSPGVRPPGSPRGAPRPGGLDAVVALSRDRERLHRRLPMRSRSTRTRGVVRARPTTARGSCRPSAQTRWQPGSRRRSAGVRSSSAAPIRTGPRRPCPPGPASSTRSPARAWSCRSPTGGTGPRGPSSVSCGASHGASNARGCASNGLRPPGSMIGSWRPSSSCTPTAAHVEAPAPSASSNSPSTAG